MKLWLAAASTVLIGAGMLKPTAPIEDGVTLVIGGDVLGYLSPCGCTKPMAGGIRRWATAVRSLRAQGPTYVVVNGGLVSEISRQDELKAEALAESYRSTQVDAINMTKREAALGRGLLASIQRLSGGALTTLSLEPSETLEAAQAVEAGPFLVSGAEADSTGLAVKSGEHARDNDAGINEFVDTAKSQGKIPILLWSGDEASARAVARRHPALAAIVFGSETVAKERPVPEGSTWLLTPGERGRSLVSVRWVGSGFTGYRSMSLGPELKDDAEVSRSYTRYLERVGSEHLLMKLPRATTARYAGNDKCFKCHSKATKVWKASDHAKALSTLEHELHDKDPDCVSCHVVGLDSVSGFRSRATTPTLTNVGCESCHGPAADHAMNPRKNPLAKIGETACKKCHNPDHSPKFNFAAFWRKIRH